MKKEKIIKAPDLTYAHEMLLAYKRDKRELESRLRAEKEIWREVYSRGSSSSWIFNSIVNKHADVIEAIPTCACLPREQGDEKNAEVLSRVLPVILERSGFEGVYSDNAWSKLKHGCAVYGVFWNPALEDGLGDIDVRSVDISDIYWDMSVSDIQDSKNLFIVSTAEVDALCARYGEFEYSFDGEATALASALGYSDLPKDSCIVVDWYYKKHLAGGREVLHLCKFAGNSILFSSELDGNYSDGWYAHGKYPVVFDRLYPTDSGIDGFGMIAIATDAQDYINRLDSNMLSYTDWASRVRFWAKRSLGVNEREFLDLSRSIVEVEGDIDEEKLRQIEISPIDDSVMECKRMKIEELKEITGSRDVSQGGITGGVTAASAISVLREAGAKTSRDGISESYRCFVKIVELVIDLIVEFYDSERTFRIVGESGLREYIGISGRAISGGSRPHFDIEISALKKSPSEANEKNELANKLFEAGAFEKENAKKTLMMLELMEFDGVEKLKATIKKEYAEELL